MMKSGVCIFNPDRKCSNSLRCYVKFGGVVQTKSKEHIGRVEDLGEYKKWFSKRCSLEKEVKDKIIESISNVGEVKPPFLTNIILEVKKKVGDELWY